MFESLKSWKGRAPATVVVGAGRSDLQRHRLRQLTSLGRQDQALHRLQQACIAAGTAAAEQKRGLLHLAFAVDAEAQRCGIAAGRDLGVVTERRTKALLQATIAAPTLGLGRAGANICLSHQLPAPA